MALTREDPLMKRLVWAGMIGLALLLTGQGHGTAHAGTIIFTSTSDGDVLTPVRTATPLNANSSLTRTYHVAQHQTAPVRLREVGIDTRQDRDDGAFELYTEGTLIADEAVSAVRVTFVLFDIFDRPMRTLTLTLVQDIAAGTTLDLTGVGAWNAAVGPHSHEARDLLSVVSSVAYVRRQNGAVWTSNPDDMTREMARLGLFHTDRLIPTGRDSRP
jgi:hypothetical protein